MTTILFHQGLWSSHNLERFAFLFHSWSRNVFWCQKTFCSRVGSFLFCNFL